MKGRLNFFLIAALVFTFNLNHGSSTNSAREVFEKCKTRTVEIDTNLKHVDIQFIQKIEMRSTKGDKDSLVFRITVRDGKFERRLISSTVPNGDRFNGGYDAFDRMFFLSEYFSDGNKVLASCEFDKPTCNGCYGINFSFAKASDLGDPLSTVTASVNAYNYTPVHVEEHITGLPLGVEFKDNIDVAYDQKAGMYFPDKIAMRVYARFLFLKGEVAVVTIKNEDLKKI